MSADESPMPMCGDCDRPLGLFYAECLTCLGSADLYGTYYHQWCEWQESQRVIPPASMGGAA